MMEIINIVNDSGTMGWIIVCFGAVGLALALERGVALYVRYGMNVDKFVTEIRGHVFNRHPEQALVLCNKLKHKPFANAFKTVIERSDQGDDFIYQAQEIALSETIPKYSKRLAILSMIANVATLLGLLGTIQGLILSFSAVAKADPSQKQQLLANGISVAMYTTALGLCVAIPCMVLHTFLNSRQNQLIESLTEGTTKLVEWLTGAHLASLHHSTLYSKDGGALTTGGGTGTTGNKRGSATQVAS